MQDKFVLKTLKRVAAVGAGVAMLGATMTGALAADLGDYPEPFVTNGVYDSANAFVVGDQASAADTLGAVDIGFNLQYLSKTAVSSEGSSSVSVSGGVTDQIPLGRGLSNTTFFDTTLEDDDVDTFFDGEVTFQSTAYSTSERLELDDGTDPAIVTSLSVGDDDYEDNAFLEMSKKKVRFAYRFDETINLSLASTSEPFEFDFMGHHIQVVDVPHTGETGANTQFTAYVGEEHYLRSDESVEVDGKTVTVVDVSSTSAVVDVDGVQKIIDDGSTATVNGIEITVDSVFSRTERAESSANLIIGEESSQTYKDGDGFIGQDDDNPMWEWDISALGDSGTSQVLRVENAYNLLDDDDNPPGVGECITLPNNYVDICFDSLTLGDDDYATYTMEWDDSIDISDLFPGNSSRSGIHLETNVDDGIELRSYATQAAAAAQAWCANETTTVKTKDVWFVMNTNGTFDVGDGKAGMDVIYKDTTDNNEKYYGTVNLSNADGSSDVILRVNHGNTKDSNMWLTVDVADADGATGDAAITDVVLQWDINGDSTTDLLDASDDILINYSISSGELSTLGSTADTEEGGELRWGAAKTNIGSKDENHMTMYGIKIVDPKGQSSSNNVQLRVPSDQVFANVVIKGTSATVSSGSTTYVPQEVDPVTLKASQVSSPTSYNLILVGGPCANDLVSDVFGLTCDGWALAEGEAMLRMAANGDNVALLVAGTTEDDTIRAASVVANYEDYALSGTENLVKGTSMTDITVE